MFILALGGAAHRPLPTVLRPAKQTVEESSQGLVLRTAPAKIGQPLVRSLSKPLHRNACGPHITATLLDYAIHPLARANPGMPACSKARLQVSQYRAVSHISCALFVILPDRTYQTNAAVFFVVTDIHIRRNERLTHTPLKSPGVNSNNLDWQDSDISMFQLL